MNDHRNQSAGQSGIDYKRLLCTVLGIDPDTPDEAIPRIIDQAISENANSKKAEVQKANTDAVEAVKIMSARIGAHEEGIIMASQPAADEYIRRRLGISKETWDKHTS